MGVRVGSFGTGLWGLAAVAAGAGCSDRAARHLVVDQANNYAYTGDLSLARVEVEAGTDATMDWSALIEDVRGRAVEPTEIDQISFVKFRVPVDDVEGLLATNELGQEDAGVDVFTYTNDGTGTCTLSELSRGSDVYQPEVDLVEDPEGTWVASVMNLPDGRQDILSSVIVIPRVGAGTDTVAIRPDSLSLDVDVDLHSAPRVETVDGGGRDYVVTWSDVTTDVFGHPLDPLLADQLWIARFADTDLGALEDGFLSLDERADAVFRYDVYAVTEIDLGITDPLDGAFDGFTTEGTWLLGLVCTRCANPVPLVLTAVDVR